MTLTTHQDEMATLGHTTFEGTIDQAPLSGLERTVAHLVEEAASRLPTEKKQRFDDAHIGPDRLLHDGVLLLYELDEKLFQYVVDGATNSTSLYALVTWQPVLEKVMLVTGAADLSDISITQARLRLDLPTRYSSNKKKIHLDYHQESAYFTVNVSQDTGVVGWIPLFDCASDDGALRILPGSVKEGRIQHEFYYEDPVKKRQRRASVPTPIIERYHDVPLESRRGDITFQHFDLIHRSGDNVRTNRVRYTVVARYSNLLANDFRPVSWT